MHGPILAEAEFPDVLVAKVYSHDGKGLGLVLYAGNDGEAFKLRFERLEEGKKYDVGGKVVAGSYGATNVEVKIDYSTAVMVLPM